MLEKLQRFIDTLGSYKEAAKYLGYSTRQLYNIRKKLEMGSPLLRHVEVYISRRISQYKPRKIDIRKGHQKNG